MACRAEAGWLCSRCKAEGFTEAAVLTHHRIPLDAGGPKFEGLEALCRIHHEQSHDRAPSKQQQEWSVYIAELRRKI